MSEGTRTFHCWASRLEVEGHPPCTHGGHDDPDEGFDCLYGDNATCLLEDGHAGAHEWTPDHEITLSFAPAPAVTP